MKNVTDHCLYVFRRSVNAGFFCRASCSENQEKCPLHDHAPDDKYFCEYTNEWGNRWYIRISDSIDTDYCPIHTQVYMQQRQG